MVDGMGCIRSVVIGIAWFITDVAAALPFWFFVHVQVQWNPDEPPQNYDFFSGLYSYFSLEADLSRNVAETSLIQVEKAGNARTLPPLFRMAQMFYGIGSSAIFVCFVCSLIYCCRKYKTATGELCLAGVLLPTALSHVLGVVFAALSATYESGTVWESLPVPNSYMQVVSRPQLDMSYGLYVGAIGALASVVACICTWIGAIRMCTHVEGVRYQMLHAPLTEEERGTYTGPGRTYGFEPKNAGFRYDGYSKPGAEVDF